MMLLVSLKSVSDTALDYIRVNFCPLKTSQTIAGHPVRYSGRKLFGCCVISVASQNFMEHTTSSERLQVFYLLKSIDLSLKLIS